MSPHGGPRPGAGRKPAGVPRRRPIQVLLTSQERAELDAAATLAERETSTWMRETCLAKARKRKKS